MFEHVRTQTGGTVESSLASFKSMLVKFNLHFHILLWMLNVRRIRLFSYHNYYSHFFFVYAGRAEFFCIVATSKSVVGDENNQFYFAIKYHIFLRTGVLLLMNNVINSWLHKFFKVCWHFPMVCTDYHETKDILREVQSSAARSAHLPFNAPSKPQKKHALKNFDFLVESVCV